MDNSCTAFGVVLENVHSESKKYRKEMGKDGNVFLL